MSFSTPSSTALGWANFVYDYLGGHPPTGFVDEALDNALNDDQNGLGGAVVGGTIYFPPLSGSGINYQLSGTHTITGSCALISTNAIDTELFFNPPGDFAPTTTALIIKGANVTLQGFTLTN
jgi:hypothetical protein